MSRRPLVPRLAGRALPACILVPGGLLALLALSCGGPQVAPRTGGAPPPHPDAAALPRSQIAAGGPPSRAGYEALREQLAHLDLFPLRRRRIVVDPGHGGFFRGVIGLGGLAEADVNLGVALYLRGLLEWAGAEAHLTRTVDRDFLSPADSSVTADLQARVAIVDSLRPDVFLSIHHNSNASLDRDLNETQTYYPIGRDGADLDLAQSIHKHLVRNLEILPAKIMGGNFYVLRHSSVPAVLGEPSMLSNPEVEARLSLAKKQELEAQAYFLGLLDYFAGGSPRWHCLPPKPWVSQQGDTLRVSALNAPPTSGIVWRFDRGDHSGRSAPSLDPSSVHLTLDGVAQVVTPDPQGDAIAWQPPPALAPGHHRLVLRGRNLMQRATPDWRAVVHYRPVPVRVDVSYLPFATQGRIDSTRAGLLSWRFVTTEGVPCESTEELRLVSKWGRSVGHRHDVVLPRYPGTRGWALIAPEDLPPSPRLERRSSEGLGVVQPLGPDDDLPHQRVLPSSFRWIFLARPPSLWPDVVVPGSAWRLRLQSGVGQMAYAIDSWDPTMPLLLNPADSAVWVEADGARPLVVDERQLPPWSTADATPPDTLVWQPILPELIGKTIVLDPAGGGSNTDGVGPFGTRGAELNLRVAEMTAALLRGAGARPRLTRTDERWVAPESKILLANEERADLFLVIGRAQPDSTPALYARHHAASAAGRRWAQLFARAAAALAFPAGAQSVAVENAAAYLLRHTACPALEVGLAAPVTAEAEERVKLPAYQQAEARALFLAAAAMLAGVALLDETIDPAALIAQDATLFPPVDEIAWLQLDGNLPWLPPRWCPAGGGPVSLQAAPPLPWRGDEHMVEIRTARDWRLVAARRLPDARLELRVVRAAARGQPE